MSPAVRGLILPALLGLAALAVLVSLGTWQMQRLAWKEALIARATERVKSPPVALPARATWETADFEAMEYTVVTVEGRALPHLEWHAFADLPKPKGPIGGTGWFVLSAVELADGGVVLVNRGFVPARAKDPATRTAGAWSGPVRIEGLLRRREARGMVSPADDPAGNVWFVRDARVMAAAAGLDPARVAPFTVDAVFTATPPGGLPQAGETQLVFTNNHLGYAVTWYGLAGALVAVFTVFARRRLAGTGNSTDRSN